LVDFVAYVLIDDGVLFVCYWCYFVVDYLMIGDVVYEVLLVYLCFVWLVGYVEEDFLFDVFVFIFVVSVVCVIGLLL